MRSESEKILYKKWMDGWIYSTLPSARTPKSQGGLFVEKRGGGTKKRGKKGEGKGEKEKKKKEEGDYKKLGALK